jgi:hypothetical protein
MTKIRVFKSLGWRGQWVIDWGPESGANRCRHCLTHVSDWATALDRACHVADMERSELKQVSP